MASSPFPEPGREILRVIRARLVGDAKIGAEESGSEFRDKLLHRISQVAKALAELPIGDVPLDVEKREAGVTD